MLQLDHETIKQVSELVIVIKEADRTEQIRGKATAFLEQKSELIDAWQKNELMLGGGRSFLINDFNLEAGLQHINRSIFLGVCKLAKEYAFKSTREKQHKIKQEKDRSDSGREY